MKIGRGVTPLSMAVIDYLARGFAEARRRALLDWGARPERVPTIKTWSPFDDVVLTRDTAPLITTDVRRAADFTDVDRVMGNTGTQARYTITLTLWLISPDTPEGASETQPQWVVTQQRNDLVAILRFMLLDRPSLGTNYLEVNIRTYTEEYVAASPTADASQRYQAAAVLSFDLKAEEWVTDSKLGEARIITVEVESDAELHVDDDDPYNLGKLRKS